MICFSIFISSFVMSNHIGSTPRGRTRTPKGSRQLRVTKRCDGQGCADDRHPIGPGRSVTFERCSMLCAVSVRGGISDGGPILDRRSLAVRLRLPSGLPLCRLRAPPGHRKRACRSQRVSRRRVPSSTAGSPLAAVRREAALCRARASVPTRGFQVPAGEASVRIVKDYRGARGDPD